MEFLPKLKELAQGGDIHEPFPQGKDGRVPPLQPKLIPSPLHQAEELLARLGHVRGSGGAPAQVSPPLGSAGVQAGHVPSKALSRSAMNSSSS